MTSILRASTLVLLAGLAACAPPPSPATPVAPVPVDGTAKAAPATACVDQSEDSVCTWIGRLGLPETRVQAVTRLAQIYEDAMTRAAGDRSDAHVKSLIDQVAVPLTEACIAGSLDDRTQSKLIRIVADLRDARTERCLTRTLAGYEPDRNEEDVHAAARAAATLAMRSAATPLLQAFLKTRASHPAAQKANFYRELHDAMIALVDPSWEKELLSLLGQEVDPRDMNSLTDEMYWQITAAEILGLLRSERAVRPLLSILLTPSKAVAQMNAVHSLLRIGKPATAPATALLRGDDRELAARGEAEALKDAGGDKRALKAASSAYVLAASLALTSLGREESTAPLLTFLDKTSEPLQLALVARDLPKLPHTPAVLKAFQRTYEKLPINLEVPYSRGSGREILLDKAPELLDASLVPWMVKTLRTMKGDENDLAPIRDEAMAAALKLYTRDQQKLIDEIGRMKSDGGTVGKGYAKEMGIARDLLADCGDKVDCYLGKVVDPQANTDATQFAGIKAAYQLGVIGGPAARDGLVAALPKIDHPAVRFAALTVIDGLTPQGDAAIAARLERMVDEANASRDQSKIRGLRPFVTFILRLRLRAER